MAALISLIMPFRNTLNHLPECLDSIIEQTYPHWELLMVDDQSTDASLVLAEDYSKRDPRIKVFLNRGSGIIPALQTAYESSRGEMISRMDSDDVMHPKRIELMFNDLSFYGPGHLALGQVEYFADKGISDGYARYEKWLNNLTASGQNYLELYKECVIPSPCWMVFREDFDRCGGFRSNRYPEDYDLTFRFYEIGLKIIPSQQILHYWRDYPSRTSRTSEHYAQNFFLDLKLFYFLKIHRTESRPLVIWGAGSKGKHLASELKVKGLKYSWMCDNPNKIGKNIYGVILQDFREIDLLVDPQIIVTVANPAAQSAILQFLHQRRMKSLVDFFFFC